ncbi:MAG: NAD-dependent epimerase/dehydratase family protein [Azonexus sp.]
MILVSGASGFIGGRLVSRFSAEGIACRSLVRFPGTGSSSVVADLTAPDSLLGACAGSDSVVHCAGYAHSFAALSGEDSALHWMVNFEGTRNFVEAAARAGVRRFVYLSSIKAMADPGEICADEGLAGYPDSDYGRSKRAAEHAVLEAGSRYGMHVVNLRLAMVYGSGGRGNLERMGRLVKRGWFPPLPETGNHRSLVHVEDVISAVRLVLDDHRANGKTYIVASQEAPSGRALFDALRQAHGLSPCHWSVPASILWKGARVGDWIGRLSGRRLPLNSEVIDRLLKSAWYSPGRIERELGWRAQITLVDGLSEMFSGALPGAQITL